MSLTVIGVEAPFARTATTLRVVDASFVGCARRPACANSAPTKVATDSAKTKTRQPRRALLPRGSVACLLTLGLMTSGLAQEPRGSVACLLTLGLMTSGLAQVL